MAFLEKFSADERDVLVSLPYRVGVWISRADNTGYPESAGAELAALERIILRKARGMFESAFVHEVMAETCAQKSQWPQWAARAQDVSADCEKAVAVIAAKLSKRDLDAYRRNVMYIAVEVAKAFREFDVQASRFSRAVDSFRRFLDRIAGVAGGAPEGGDWRRISFEEDVALADLSKALGMDGGEENILDENEERRRQ